MRKIVGNMYVSADEDAEIRERYKELLRLMRDAIARPAAGGPKAGELMPKIYDSMVRMNDEDIRKEYITQMEIILNDDPTVSEKLKGIAEGLSIKLGEMMDTPRHQRIAKLAKEEEEKKKGREEQAKSAAEVEKRRAKEARKKALNKEAYEHLRPIFGRLQGVRPVSLQGEQRRLAQRYQNRLELRMILMDIPALKMIGPGQYKSMGTGGLRNEEVRALHHKLSNEQELLNTSADAQRLLSMLDRKVDSLPSAELDLAHYGGGAAEVAPRRRGGGGRGGGRRDGMERGGHAPPRRRARRRRHPAGRRRRRPAAPPAAGRRRRRRAARRRRCRRPSPRWPPARAARAAAAAAAAAAASSSSSSSGRRRRARGRASCSRRLAGAARLWKTSCETLAAAARSRRRRWERSGVDRRRRRRRRRRRWPAAAAAAARSRAAAGVVGTAAPAAAAAARREWRRQQQQQQRGRRRGDGARRADGGDRQGGQPVTQGLGGGCRTEKVSGRRGARRRLAAREARRTTPFSSSGRRPRGTARGVSRVEEGGRESGR